MQASNIKIQHRAACIPRSYVATTDMQHLRIDLNMLFDETLEDNISDEPSTPVQQKMQAPNIKLQHRDACIPRSYVATTDMQHLRIDLNMLFDETLEDNIPDEPSTPVQQKIDISVCPQNIKLIRQQNIKQFRQNIKQIRLNFMANK